MVSSIAGLGVHRGWGSPLVVFVPPSPLKPRKKLEKVLRDNTKSLESLGASKRVSGLPQAPAGTQRFREPYRASQILG